MQFNRASITFWLTLVFILSTLPVFASPPDFDYDGDGKTDPVVARLESQRLVWYFLQSRDGFRAQQWGVFENTTFDTPLPGDYDGDGRSDIAVSRQSDLRPNKEFYILNSSTNTMTFQQWGLRSGDQPVPQDYDGDGKTDIAIFRSGEWWILRSSDGKVQFEKFGMSRDQPLRGGDYDGDGKADLAVVRYGARVGGPGGYLPTTTFIRLSTDGSWRTYNLGDGRITGVMAGDYDGDGKADVAIWQGNLWLWIRSSDGKLDSVRFGSVGRDTPIPGDYDGDGKSDAAVFDPGGTYSYFYIMGSRDGFRVQQWGLSGDYNPATINFIPSVGF